MPSPIFSAGTFAPYLKNDEIFASRYRKILSVSREKYSKARSSVESRINKTMQDVEKQEIAWEKKKEDFKKKKEEEKKKKHLEMMAQREENKK